MRVALVVAILLVAGCAALAPGDEPPGRDAGFGGLVVAAEPRAAEAGAAMLRAGGSAADAAAAVQWALTVTEPQSSGIGGGTFLLWRDGATGAFEFLDGRERAPAATTSDVFVVPGDLAPPFPHSTRGYAVGVPGTVKLFGDVHARHGRLPWEQTFEPAIGLARNGFEVGPDLAADIASRAEMLRSWPATARIYLAGATCPPDVLAVSAPTGCVGGTPLAVGDLLANPDLAATLETVAEEGPDAFYQGPIAQAIALASHQRLGRLTEADLAAYEVVEREPARGSYRDVEVVTSPSPGGGPILLHMLGVIEGLPARGPGLPDEAELHALIETQKLAYADRNAHNADPDVVEVPQRGLTHPAYAADRRALLDLGKASSYEPGDPWRYENATAPAGRGDFDEVDAHTSHFLVVDADGNIVSSTTTIEAVFGTGITVPGYGFLLNNQLTDFDRAPGGPNEPGPMKRPRSNMVPSILLRDGEPILVVGAAGGSTITTSVLQVILHVVDGGLDVQEAVAAPRVFGPFANVSWDGELDPAARGALEARSHVLVEDVDGISTLQAASLVGSRWTGAPDTRNLDGGGAVVVPRVSR